MFEYTMLIYRLLKVINNSWNLDMIEYVDTVVKGAADRNEMVRYFSPKFANKSYSKNKY